MSKDIYRLLNNANIETDEYENSELTDQEKDMIYRMAINSKGRNTIMKKSLIKKTAVAAAAIAAVFTFVFANTYRPEEIKPGLEPGSTSSGKETSGNSFILKVSADTVDPYTEGKLVILNDASGCDNFSGLNFGIYGENIDEVKISVTNGSLCKVVKTISSSPSHPAGEEKYIHSVQELRDEINGELTYVSYDITYAGSEITEKYDENNLYGFCVSGERYEELFSELDGDVKQLNHSCIDEFNDQTLTVVIRYLDGTEETKKYSLKSGKLKVDTSEEKIQNDDFTMKVIPEFTYGEGQPWVYGIVASETE